MARSTASASRGSGLLWMGWLCSALGLVLLVAYWMEGRERVLDWVAGLVALSGRPFAGYIVGRQRAASSDPE